MNPVAWLRTLWDSRGLILAVLFVAVIVGLIGYAKILSARLDAAEANTAAAETRRAEAENRARVNAETAAALARTHEEQLASIARDAQAARRRAEEAAQMVETLRRDPTHSTVAAPVLGRAVEQLRQRRAGARASADPGALAAEPARTPAAAGAPSGGGAADPGDGR